MSDASDELFSGGYPITLFDAPIDVVNEYLCGVCTSVCKQTVSPECCGQLFCTECYNKWMSSKPTCPTCKTRDPSLQKVFFVDRKIRTLPLTCPNGCRQGGLYIGTNEQTLKTHLQEQCPRRTVTCTQGCGGSYLWCEEEQHLATRCFRTCPNDCDLVTLGGTVSRDGGMVYSPHIEPYVIRYSRKWREEVKIGSILDVYDGDLWYAGRVIAVQQPDSPLTVARWRVRYAGWSDKHDKLIPGNSENLAPLHTYTTPMRCTRYVGSTLECSHVWDSAMVTKADMVDVEYSVRKQYLSEELEHHLQSECRKSMGTCSVCSTRIERQQMETHKLDTSHRLAVLERRLNRVASVCGVHLRVTVFSTEDDDDAQFVLTE